MPDATGRRSGNAGTATTYSALTGGLAADKWSYANADTKDLDFTSGAWSVGGFGNLSSVSSTSGQNPEVVGRRAYTDETINSGWSLAQSGGTTVYGAFSFANNGFANYQLLGTSTATVGDVFLGMTSDGTSTRRLFVKGVQESTTATNLNPATCASPLTPATASAGVWAGAYLVLAWNREVPAIQWAMLNNDPYCFLVPAGPGFRVGSSAAPPPTWAQLSGGGGQHAIIRQVRVVGY
jgi:hypothetical protein